jgi:hypothetical protein
MNDAEKKGSDAGTAEWRHFFLYAKNHYTKSERIRDLLTILSHEVGIPLKYAAVKDVYDILVGLFLRYATEYEKRHFFEKLFSEKDSVKIGDVIFQLLGALSVVKVRDGDKVLINLGEPDGDVLPLIDTPHC